MSTNINFSAGHNIAMKVPPHLYEATVRFYRDVIGLKPIEKYLPDIVFEFGANQLWLDNVPALSQAEVWLELVTDDLTAAAQYLNEANVVRCDEIEPLPDGFEGFWIANPASIIHLVCQDDESM